MKIIRIGKIGKIFCFISVGFGVMLAVGGAISSTPFSIAVGAGLIALGGIVLYLNNDGENKSEKNHHVIKERA